MKRIVLFSFFSLFALFMKAQSAAEANVRDSRGAVVRVNPSEKNIYLSFSADGVLNGGEFILDALKKHKAKGNFFLTGNALRNPKFKLLIERMVAEGHYVGGHSDKHVLYADWGAARPTLMSTDSITTDIRANFAELAKFGIKKEDALWFLPPYEHYNEENVRVLNTLGLKVCNYTPGTATPADYTTPDMKNYKSSQVLIDALYKFEEENNLNGAIVLIHPGVHESRTDRLYYRLGEIIKHLKRKGYTCSALI